MRVPETRYATTSDGLSIAYQQFGTGPHVVWVTGTASHVELFWEFPGWAHTLRRLGERCTVTWFDKRGTGLSDRTLLSTSLEDRMEDIRAVMDEAGIDSASVIGLSESGAMSALFAATFPERVERLVVVASWAYRPDTAQAAAAFETLWGQGTLLEAIWAQGFADKDLLGRIERAMGTPTSMASLLRANASFDVRPILPLVRTPSLVVHCTDDPIIPVSYGREFASLLPDTRMVEVGGAFHGSARPEDMGRYGEAIEAFLVGTEHRAASTADRVLATVLFTDIVGSTDRAATVGDSRWTELLDDHDQISRRAVEGVRGRVVKMTGDGVLATFDAPASAIAAGHQMIRDLAVVGVEIRAGIHTGEVERRGDDIGGIGVNLAARVMAAATDGELWVSSTVPGLTIGAGVECTSRGRQALKGIPGEWELFATQPLHAGHQ
ncbi:MAG TPA: adenylate/guanylate cyclase domain-containing protein [Acidimicrobiales bacterium]|nr:adenylate/guanylate cyclase domain-containing protein [Acidimicrobiales bacterium]